MPIRKIFRYVLPFALMGLSIAVVVALVAVANGKRPERKDTAEVAVLAPGGGAGTRCS